MNVLNHPKKVLHVVSAMNRGGVETLIMNIYRNVDKNKIQFDFITHREEVCHYDKEIESLGGTIFRIPSLGKVGPIRYLREITNILKENDYVALHAHTDYQCGFPVLAANLTGIKKRISHSHSNNWGFGNSYKAKIKLSMLRALIRYNSNEFCACSVESGQFLFGNQKRNIRIFKNGIDIKNFQIIPDCYQSVRALS
ncbi:glycosyltransferase [Metabacillus endolithicus]|uniref:glycosyltransferase n=1 Tax=Metabacillus endolithicus TaxID=1535204 RepID=UPI001FF8AE9C|nr:glycosyltransferase [Metabacillus endolithicus]UPG64508.1 glycosyltransferase [Metabacillus endolithicus]